MEWKELAPVERTGIRLSYRNAWLSYHNICRNRVAGANSAGFLAVVVYILLISPLGSRSIRAALVAYADHCIDNLHKHSIVFALPNT